MKKYKDFEKILIGESDIATLILVGCDDDGLKLEQLAFGEDGVYSAYLIDDISVPIPEHYKHVYTFKHWLKIYDDFKLTFHKNVKEVRIYRAGDFGCIIQIEK